MKIFFCITLVWILADNQSSGFLCTFDDRELGYTARSGIDTNPGYTWKNGKIPYYFKPDAKDKTLMRNVMNEIEKHSCFRFIRMYNIPNIKHLQIRTQTSGKSCQGVVTLWTQKEMTMDIIYGYDQSCNYGEIWSLVLHELMHVLGVIHTQNREDRNDYIRVNPNNIQEVPRHARDQYKRCIKCRIEPTIPYDCESIMHYGTGFYQKDGAGPTMTAKNPSSCRLTPGGPKKATITDWKLLTILGSKVCHQADCECINPFDCGSSFTADSSCHVECNGGCVDQYRTQNRRCRSVIACGIYHSDSIGRK